MTTEKSRLRARLRARRKALSGPRRARAEQRISAHVMRLVQDLRPRRVAVYIAIGSEADLGPAIRWLLRRGTPICVPCVRAGRMVFTSWPHPRAWRRGPHGLLQPLAPRAPRLGRRDLVLLPALGIDDLGNRLGQGGGYYDRHLAGGRARRYAVVFRCQRVDRLPVEAWDIAVEGAISESGIEQFHRHRT